jgi:hypothetical protein
MVVYFSAVGFRSSVEKKSVRYENWRGFIYPSEQSRSFYAAFRCFLLVAISISKAYRRYGHFSVTRRVA